MTRQKLLINRQILIHKTPSIKIRKTNKQTRENRKKQCMHQELLNMLICILCFGLLK